MQGTALSIEDLRSNKNDAGGIALERPDLEELILKLLERGVFKTTGQLVQEFRMEYPRSWSELEKEGRRLFGGTCGAYQQPATRISQVLFNIPADRCLCRRSEEGYSWSAPVAEKGPVQDPEPPEE